MPHLEADIGVVHGRIVEGLRIPFYKDVYFETVFIPGFSDTHAHPQVIDAGLDTQEMFWRNSYEWLDERELHIDEVMVRQDIGVSTRLAELALKRAVLEGVTMIAFTGVLEANLKARLRFPTGPRLVLLPTLMDKKGWSTPQDVSRLYEKYKKYISDSLLRIGVFVHSLKWAGPKTFYGAIELASKGRMPLGLHLSEGISEGDVFKSRIAVVNRPPRIVAVHCIDDDPASLGIRCSSCPASNMLLYNRTRESLKGVTSFGSDWPHLLGSVPRHLGLILKIFPGRLSEVIRRITTGGYQDYGVSHTGDLVAYDAPLDRVLTGKPLPKLVMVAGSVVVEEGAIKETGETLRVIEKETLEVSKYVGEVYGDGTPPLVPGPQYVWDIVEGLGGEPRIHLARKTPV
ncbi:MAG: hypothetical protein F7C37_07255 [Desulfurococcales archaeon]|nr:hypothetical protein [Desulfurococcales archaeon]